MTIMAQSKRTLVPFTMPYACNPQELIDAVTSALRASPIPDIATDPLPFCIMLEMAPGHIRYAAVVWMLKPGLETLGVSAVLNRIYFSLERAGIPATEITHLLEMKAAVDGHGQRSNPVDVLRRTPIFRQLNDPELFELGARLHYLSFAPGERIIRGRPRRFHVHCHGGAGGDQPCGFRRFCTACSGDRSGGFLRGNRTADRCPAQRRCHRGQPGGLLQAG